MSKTSSKVKNRWNAKAYDQLPVRVPHGRKEDIEAHAQSKGKSVNGLMNDLIREDMGIAPDAWKKEWKDGGTESDV